MNKAKLFSLLFIFLGQIYIFPQNFWQKVFSGDVQNPNLIVSSQDNIFIISGGLLRKSTDHSLTWSSLPSAVISGSIMESSSLSIFVSDINGFSLGKSSDEGNTWVSANSPSFGSPIMMQSVKDDVIFYETGVLGGGYSFRSTDNGETWTQVGIANKWLFDVGYESFGYTYASFRGNLPNDHALLYRSSNLGSNWDLINSAPVDAEYVYSTPGGIIFASRGSTLFRSINSGLQWEQINTFSYPIKDITQNSLTHIFVSLFGGGVYRSTDIGQTWVQINTGLENLSVTKLVADDLGYLYCISAGNIYRSIESTVPVELVSFTAQVLGNSVTLNWVTASEINNKGFEIERRIAGEEMRPVGFVQGMGTSTELNYYSFVDKDINSGIYFYRLKQIDFDGTSTYSSEIEAKISLNVPDGNMPSEFTLYQNYPNPFNPATKIRYSLPENGLTTLKVYDVLGNLVSVLVDEMKSAGEYEVEFSSNGLTSGVYFYELRSGDFISAKKFILTK